MVRFIFAVALMAAICLSHAKAETPETAKATADAEVAILKAKESCSSAECQIAFHKADAAIRKALAAPQPAQPAPPPKPAVGPVVAPVAMPATLMIDGRPYTRSADGTYVQSAVRATTPQCRGPNCPLR